jgi:anti-anti-sigma factor
MAGLGTYLAALFRSAGGSKWVRAVELLAVDRDDRADAIVVRATGDIDSSNADELIAHLTSALELVSTGLARPIIVDLQAVTFFGSAGLNAVLDCHKQALAAGTAVRVVADNAAVVRLIEVANLDSVLAIYPTLSDALQRPGRKP